MEAHQIEQLNLTAVAPGIPNNRFAGGRIKEHWAARRGDPLWSMAAFVFFYLLHNLRGQGTTLATGLRVYSNAVMVLILVRVIT
jgi:hypothetical protein